MQRLVNHLQLGGPVAFDQRQIGLAGLPLTELVLQVLQSAALFGHQQNATGVTVQPVHQLQQLGLRAGLAQLLNHPKTHARASMNRHPSRFVDGHQAVVLKKGGEFAPRRWALGLFGHFV